MSRRDLVLYACGVDPDAATGGIVESETRGCPWGVDYVRPDLRERLLPKRQVEPTSGDHSNDHPTDDAAPLQFCRQSPEHNQSRPDTNCEELSDRSDGFFDSGTATAGKQAEGTAGAVARHRACRSAEEFLGC